MSNRGLAGWPGRAGSLKLINFPYLVKTRAASSLLCDHDILDLYAFTIAAGLAIKNYCYRSGNTIFSNRNPIPKAIMLILIFSRTSTKNVT